MDGKIPVTWWKYKHYKDKQDTNIGQTILEEKGCFKHTHICKILFMELFKKKVGVFKDYVWVCFMLLFTLADGAGMFRAK